MKEVSVLATDTSTKWSEPVHYGLMEGELDFVINCDIGYRTRAGTEVEWG